MKKIIIAIFLFFPITLFSAFEFIEDNNMLADNDSLALLTNPVFLNMSDKYDFNFLFKTPVNISDFDTGLNSIFISAGLPLSEFGVVGLGIYNFNIEDYQEQFARLGYANSIRLNDFYIDNIVIGIKTSYYYVNTFYDNAKFFSASPGILIAFNRFYLDTYMDFLSNKGNDYLHNDVYFNLTYFNELFLVKLGIKNTEVNSRFFFNIKYNIIKNTFFIKFGYNHNGAICIGFDYSGFYDTLEIPISVLYEYSEEMQDMCVRIGCEF